MKYFFYKYRVKIVSTASAYVNMSQTLFCRRQLCLTLRLLQTMTRLLTHLIVFFTVRFPVTIFYITTIYDNLFCPRCFVRFGNLVLEMG